MEDVEAACTVPAGRLAEFIKHIAAINRVRVAMSRFVFFMGFSFLSVTIRFVFWVREDPCNIRDT